LNGADRFCQALAEHGVECVFGLPGTQNIALYEALRRHHLRSIVATHELAAAFMANGYYRSSGRLAAVVTIPGPGFAFALPALAEARHDSAAVLHVTGQPPRGERPYQFQQLDQRRLVASLVKGAFGAEGPDDVAGAVACGVELALGGEPGPVLVDYTDEALEGTPSAAGPPAPTRKPSSPPDPAKLAAAAEWLATARRPVVMAGQGCADAAPALRELVERLGAPTFTTLSGRGVLPEDHPLALGFEAARDNVAVLNELIGQADCVLALGCKLTAAGTDGFRLELPADRLLHVDAGDEVVGASYAAKLAVVARAEDFLGELRAALRARATSPPAWEAAQIERCRQRLAATSAGAWPEPAFAEVPGGAAGFFAALRAALPRDAMVVTDSGLHQMLVRRHLAVLSPRGLIAPSDFQSMGFGLPAAIGATLASPSRRVVAMIGDGGFAMTGLELLTAVRERVALPVIVFNDGQMNRIRVQQFARYGHAEGCELLNPDFGAFASAVGVAYARVGEDPEATLRVALASEAPILVEVVLGDSSAIQLRRVRGLARGAARRHLPSAVSRWLRKVRG
jgi:acetolactate synthase-1/2/3 large subunit